MTDTATRRALFGAATALTLAAPMAAVTAPLARAPTLTTAGGVSPLWIERDRLYKTTSRDDEEGDAVFDQMVAVENRILREPISSAADIAARIRLTIYRHGRRASQRWI